MTLYERAWKCKKIRFYRESRVGQALKTGRNDGRFEVSRLKLGLKSDRFLSEKSALMHLCLDFDFGGGFNPLICHFEIGQHFYFSE